jgi:hypothetical protein
LELSGCTLRDNKGGGVYNEFGMVLMENCTVASNGGGGIVNRGGRDGKMHLRHCTVAYNKLRSGGDSGIVTWGSLIFENTLISHNFDRSDPASSVLGDFETRGWNLIWPKEGVLLWLEQPSMSEDARMLELKTYRGIDTIALLPDSPVIDAAGWSTISLDQTGLKRPLGKAPDIGAIEVLVTSNASSSNPNHFALQGEVLEWSAVPGAIFEVFLDDGSGSVSLGQTTSESIELPGTLNPNTVHQWRVDTTVDGRTYVGFPQTFTTRGPLVVTTLADEDDPGVKQGEGDSLREALRAALDGELIQFASHLSGGTILLGDTLFGGTGQLTIDKDVTIDASALASQITINPGSASRAIGVTGGSTVVLKGLRISNGSADQGGGILNDGGSLTLRRCTLSGNAASEKGGGVYNINGGSLTVSDGTVFSSNVAADGGGISNEIGSSLEVNGATFSRNTATVGGGISNRGQTFTVKVASFTGNGADQGGGIFNAGTTGLVENSTLSANGSDLGEGGGISNHSGNLTLRHCTITDNVGGGVFNKAPAALTLDNTIVASNFDLDNEPSDLQGDYTAIGANVLRIHSVGSLLGGTEPITGDPVLGPLNSGVMKPLVGSSVIDTGVATGNTPSIDQKRAARPNGPAPDIGAVESRLSADATLDWLTTTAGPISPAFQASTTDYTATVPNAVTTAAVRPAKGRSGQTIDVRINGGAFSTVPLVGFGPPNASADLPLNPGDNTIEVKVTAPNGSTTKSYTITVVRGAPTSANSGLAALTTTAGPLSSAFDPFVSVSHLTVPNTTASTTVTAPAAKDGAIVEVGSNFGAFAPLATGAASSPLALNVGANTIDIRVIGEGDAVAALYTLTVTREEPAQSNASLASLSTNAGALSPTFAPGVAFYKVTVIGSVTTAIITPVAAQPTATIQVRANGGAFSNVASGAASQAMDLNAGANSIDVKVRASDGTEESYTVVVTRVVSSLEWVSESGDGTSEDAVISSDCRYVAFSSQATNLVAGAGNGRSQIFVRDRILGTVEHVSVSDAGKQGDFDSLEPSISGDGRYVAFQSEATNLVPNDRNGQSSRSRGRDIFVYDRTAKTIERVSLTEGGGEANQKSENPSISEDSRFVAFNSSANNLVAGYRNGEVNVYVHDRVEDTIAGISVPFADYQSNRSSLNPAISGDGNYVAFQFNVSLNDGNNSYSHTDIYLYHRATRAVERITGARVGRDADGEKSEFPSISGDGRYVTFQSNLEYLDFNDLNRAVDVFVYDRVTELTSRVSTNGGIDTETSRASTNAVISGDGRFVAFDSQAETLVDSDANGKVDVFVKNLITGELSLVSASPAGVQGDGNSTSPSISGDGQCITFQTIAKNLAGSDANNKSDIFASVVEEVTPSAFAVAEFTSNLDSFGPGDDVSVENEIDSLLLRPVSAEPGSTIEIQVNSGGFIPIDSNTISAELPLVVGENIIEVKVTAPDGSTEQSYIQTVTRSPSHSADLSGLFLTSGDFVPLTPDFAADTAAYTSIVSSDTTTVNLRPGVAHPSATVTVNGAIVESGAASTPIDLIIGSNTITTVVTAEDGTTKKTYTVAVTREPSHNVDLASLLLSVEPISGLLPFNSDRTDYSMRVSNATASIAFTPTVADSTASVTVNGQPVASGAASSAIDLAVSSNSIIVEVTAQDGTTTKTYTLTVTREEVPPLSSNANLAALTASTGSLSPAFNENTISYSFSVATIVTNTTFTPTLANSKATVKVNGADVPSGAASSPLALNVGANAIAVLVTAENGTNKTYTVTVTRYAPAGVPKPFRITGITRTPSAIALEISDGTAYDIEYSTDLVNWTVIASGVTGIFQDSNAIRIRGTGYYRGVSK